MSRDILRAVVKTLFLSRCSRIAATIALVSLLARPAHAQNHFERFQTYLGTIDIASKGTGLLRQGNPTTGLATVEIDLRDQIPVDADIVAAFGYFVSLEKTDKASSAVVILQEPGDPTLLRPPNPNPNDPAAGLCPPVNPAAPGCLVYPVTALAKPLGNKTAPACWSGGGSTGASMGNTTQRAYRVDLERYMKMRPDPTNPNILRRVPWIIAQVRSTGSTGFVTPLVEGFSVVVVYRRADLKFASVSLYDGSSTLNNATDNFDLTVKFYQASTTPNARIGLGIGDGQEFPELLYVNGTNQSNLLENSPFFGREGERWDNREFILPTSGPKSVSPGATSLTTRISHGQGSFDCLSMVFVYAKVDAQDTDGDGLVDDWEINGYKDIDTDQVRVNLPAMGANYRHKDLFLEVDKMQEFANDLLGKPHVHDLKDGAIRLVGDAFKNATEIQNPDGIPGIKFHVDIGPFTCPGSQYCGNPYVMTQFTEGGDIIDERKPAFFCDSTLHPDCIFPNQPGMIYWMKGLHTIKNSHQPNNPIGCGNNPTLPTTCKLRFSDRGLVFHYLVMGHALAVPALNPDGTLQRDTSGKLIGNSTSGRAQENASDLVLTFGKWNFANAADFYVGDATTQGGGLLHELAHNLGGYHGGVPRGFNFTTNPPTPTKGLVCNMNHLSVLNYLYQRGLNKADGGLTVDLSHGVFNANFPNENENALNEFFGISGPGPTDTPYRLRWYAPKAIVALRLGVPAASLASAKQYCDGSGPFSGDSGLVRVDAFAVKRSGVEGVPRSPIDWNYNGVTDNNTVNLNANFDRFIEPTSAFSFDTNEFNGDWDYTINKKKGLQQIGMRRSLWGLSLGVGAKHLLQAGEAEGATLQDLGEPETGEPETGEPETGEPETGEPETGEPETGEPETGEPETGALTDQAFDVTGPNGLTGTLKAKSVDLTWQPPLTGGTITQYTIQRAQDTGPFELLAIITPTTPGIPPPTSYSDGDVQKKTYTYVVFATVVTGTTTEVLGPSNPFIAIR